MLCIFFIKIKIYRCSTFQNLGGVRLDLLFCCCRCPFRNFHGGEKGVYIRRDDKAFVHFAQDCQTLSIEIETDSVLKERGLRCRRYLGLLHQRESQTETT
jgi:hypothetical protein